MTDPKFEKLPKWAQAHITKIEREREAAIKALHKFSEEEKPSKIYVEDYVCIGSRGPEKVRHYIQNFAVNVAHAGVRLQVSTNLVDGVELRFTPAGHQFGQIAVFTEHSAGMKLVNPIHLAALEPTFTDTVDTYRTWLGD